MTLWRVLSVFSGNEIDVASRMNAAGVEAYCPVYTSVNRSRHGHRDMTIERVRPLFPRYLFARLHHDDRVDDFERSTCKIVVHRRTALNDDQIAAVRATAFNVSAVSDRTKIHPGAFVELCRGVLEGARADVLRVRGRRAVIALLSGSVLRVNISDLETVSHGNEARERVAI